MFPNIPNFSKYTKVNLSQELDEARRWSFLFQKMDLGCSRFLSRKFSSVQLLIYVWLFLTPWTTARQAFLSISNSQACSNSCPLSWCCHPTISSSVVSFSSCLQSFPASVSFLGSQFFVSHDQSIGASASTLVLSMNTQDWFPLELIGLILQFKVLTRVFSTPQ